MTLTADLFFSFRSPYSYLAIGRYRAMAEEWDVDIALRPVYPLAIREPDFFAIAWIYKDEYAKAGFQMLPSVDPDGSRTARQGACLRA